MHTITPTELRKTLFHELQTALRGIPVRVETRHGNAVILSENAYRSLSRGRSGFPRPDEAKIAGRIVGSLDTADAELQAHLELPS